MPQLDFFLFPHIVIQTCIILIVLLNWLSNTKIILLLKSQKTRALLVKKLKAQTINYTTTTDTDGVMNTLKVIIDDVQIRDNEVKNNKHD